MARDAVENCAAAIDEYEAKELADDDVASAEADAYEADEAEKYEYAAKKDEEYATTGSTEEEVELVELVEALPMEV